MSAASRYEVLVRIATGGMASVFVGRLKAQLGVSRLVALKRPHPFILADPKLRKSVIEEARTASAIHHANVVAVVDVELVDDEPVLVLEYVEGATLSELVRGAEAIPEVAFAPIAMRILLDTARGLHAAHEMGVLHRDVTPQNVLVGVDGVGRLSDFGIAKSSGRAEPTVTSSLKGKLGYLAPEYVASRAFVVESDLFSLAVVAWEALTKRRLFGGGNEVETLSKIVLLERPPLPPELAAFEPVLARALAREPTDRPTSVAAFARELEAAATASIGIASQAEVGAFVSRACGAQLNERRAALAAATPRPAEEMEDLPLRAPTARDEIETASVTDPPAPREAAARPLPAPAPASPASPRVAPWVGLIALALIVLGVVAFVALRSSSPTAASAPAVASASASSASNDAPVASAASAAPVETAAPTAAAPPPRANSRGVRGNRGVVGTKPAPPAHGPAAFPSHAPPNPYAP